MSLTSWGVGTPSETVVSSTSREARSKEAGDSTNKCGIIISSLLPPPLSLGMVARFLIVPLEDT